MPTEKKYGRFYGKTSTGDIYELVPAANIDSDALASYVSEALGDVVENDGKVIDQEVSITTTLPTSASMEPLSDDAIVAYVTGTTTAGASLVTSDGTQTITGQKTFTVSPVVPTPASDSDGNVPATTAWVNDAIPENVVVTTGSPTQAQLDAADNNSVIVALGEDVPETVASYPNAVSIENAETITGQKTFSHYAKFYGDSVTNRAIDIDLQNNSFRDITWHDAETTTGASAVIRKNKNGALELTNKNITTGNSSVFNGAGIFLAANGNASLVANSGTSSSGQKVLTAGANGTLTWDSKEVITNGGDQTVGGTKTFLNGIIAPYEALKRPDNTTGLWLFGGSSTDATAGAKLFLTGGSNETIANQGRFLIQAGNASGYKQFIGKPDGTLTWDGKDVITNGGNQTVGGVKTFTGEIYIKRTIPMLILERTDTTSSNYQDIRFAESGGTMGAAIRHIRGADLSMSTQYGDTGAWTSGPYVTLKGGDGTFHIGAKQGGSTSSELIGNYNGNLTWRGNTIQTTSDERLKTAFSEFPDAVLDAWETISWEQFKYKSAVAEKGEENCRWHSGLVAQHVQRAFEDQGQDVLKYGILCFDEWDAEYADNDDGSKTLTKKAGNQWTVRYEEALCMEAAYQRREAERSKERIATLEQRLNELEATLSTLISNN